MAIHLGDILANLNGNVSGNVNGGNSAQQIMREAVISAANNNTTQVRQAVEQLKNLMLGDIFTGEITSMENGRATISLNNGQQITAALLENVNLKQGDSMMFMVEKNDDSQISLKVLDSNSQEMVMINKALAAAGMTMNDSSIAMVKNLLDNNMPIDKQTLTEVSRHMMNFPDTSIDTLVRLIKLDIPVTENNIIQFEAYKSNEHQITRAMTEAVAGFEELANQYIKEGKQEDFVKLFSNIVDVMTDRDPGKLVPLMENERADLPPKLLEAFEQLKNNPDQNLGQLLEHMDFKDTREVKAFTRVFEQLVKKEFLLTPKQIAEKEEVQDFYARLREKTSELGRLMTESGNAEQPVSKAISMVRDNVNFMNDLSQNMTFMQFPVKLPDGTAQGDLYVYTNKKSLREHPDNISALLHLDMEHLGPMDIYVTMKGKNVNTNFCLESEEMLDFIYEHIDLLNARIDKLGLNFQFSMNIKEQDEIHFTEDFLDQSAPLIDVKSYLFDSKA